ncbi:unnamed protein product [Nyctereutes procyonoides]|uniref:(raccoon dog) hypothetical protein n=1 Tax=Nyctereutes procyonoides TaxID=34880 RepID=A0A811XVZ6_NYCPR|nr:unnamed protein product [Nyctereutes procyonoides]
MGDRGTSNGSEVTDFIPAGFRVSCELHILLFLLFPPVYAMILLGTVGMVAVTLSDPRLNTPTYFLLGHLSFTDLFRSSVVAPKAMINFWSEGKSISFAGDRFIAMCNSLLYSVQISTRLCIQWVAGSHFCVCISSVLQTSMTLTLSFCASRAIDHFYCDDRPLQGITCSDLYFHRMVSLPLGSIIILPTIIVILVSYMYIVSTVLKTRSTEGRKKAFSTCSSHLGVVSVLYGAIIFMYFIPDRFPERSKVAPYVIRESLSC